jgi:hypothetical protein
MWAIYVIFTKLSKENNCPLGKNSQNLVTLVGSDAGQLCPGPIEAMTIGGGDVGIWGLFFS